MSENNSKYVEIFKVEVNIPLRILLEFCATVLLEHNYQKVNILSDCCKLTKEKRKDKE